MNENEAYQKAEEYFMKLHREAEMEYSKKIQTAYEKAHDFYIELRG